MQDVHDNYAENKDVAKYENLLTDSIILCIKLKLKIFIKTFTKKKVISLQ